MNLLCARLSCASLFFWDIFKWRQSWLSSSFMIKFHLNKTIGLIEQLHSHKLWWSSLKLFKVYSTNWMTSRHESLSENSVKSFVASKVNESKEENINLTSETYQSRFGQKPWKAINFGGQRNKLQGFIFKMAFCNSFQHFSSLAVAAILIRRENVSKHKMWHRWIQLFQPFINLIDCKHLFHFHKLFIGLEFKRFFEEIKNFVCFKIKPVWVVTESFLFFLAIKWTIDVDENYKKRLRCK